ncbi:MAG: VOC family protein [Candidatus Acidiferrales bacterium]
MRQIRGGGKKERGARRSHKRLLSYFNVNRTSLDHLLLGEDADVDKNVEWSEYNADVKSGADAMTDEPSQTTPRPILNSIAAQLFVANIKTSCDFYTNKLGFAVEFIYGDPPYYGQVVRDNARLNLRLVFGPVFVAEVREREQLLSASITVATANEITQLFLNYQAAGVSFHQALKKEPWGAKTFVVSDPDENLILFAGPTAD